jgi:hypothetical protein
MCRVFWEVVAYETPNPSQYFLMHISKLTGSMNLSFRPQLYGKLRAFNLCLWKLIHFNHWTCKKNEGKKES